MVEWNVASNSYDWFQLSCVLALYIPIVYYHISESLEEGHRHTGLWVLRGVIM